MSNKAVRSTQKAEPVIVYLWQYNDGRLTVATDSAGRYRSVSYKLRDVARDLLPLLKRILKDRRLYCIAVVPSALGGFASSRIIMVTLNTIAWLSDAPIVAVDPSFEHNAETRFAVIKKIVGNRWSGQAFPVYALPPDIMPSKKQRRFTVVP